MIIDDDFLSKLDSLEELPVSEEMLGAYIEGNQLLGSEIHEIDSFIASDPYISNLIELSKEMGVNEKVNMEDPEAFFDELEGWEDRDFDLPVLEKIDGAESSGTDYEILEIDLSPFSESSSFRNGEYEVAANLGPDLPVDDLSIPDIEIRNDNPISDFSDPIDLIDPSR